MFKGWYMKHHTCKNVWNLYLPSTSIIKESFASFCIVCVVCYSNNISLFVVISHMVVGSKLVLINFAITFSEQKKQWVRLSVYICTSEGNILSVISKTLHTIIYNFKHTHPSYFAKMRQLQIKVFGEMRGIIKW